MLSACLIVKNEEKLLPQCLDSIRDLADEVILVDTGSEDRTQDIGKLYGCKMYQYQWNDDFSAARNYSIEQATGDWILWIDADEEIDLADIATARRHMASDVDGIIVHMLSEKAGGGYAWHALEKFFRRGKGHFEGIKHNQLYSTSNKVFAAIRIYHYGYALERQAMIKKWDRDEKLLLRQISADGSDTFAWRNLVRLYSASKRHDKAIGTGLKVLEMGNNGVLLSSTSEQLIMLDISDGYIQRGDYDEAEVMLKSLLEKNPANIDGNFRVAELYMRLDRYQEALEYYQRYIQLLQHAYTHPPGLPLVVDSWGSAVAAQNNMAICQLEIGEYANAVNTFKLAVLQQREALDDKLLAFMNRVTRRERLCNRLEGDEKQ